MGVANSKAEVNVKKLLIKNFKSFKDFELDLTNLNMIVGRNGSGKTNLIEALKLYKMVLDYLRGKEVNPFLDWWGYNNVAWKGNEKNPIAVGFQYDVEYDEEKVEATYELICSGVGGEFKILKERLEIPDKFIIETTGNRWNIFPNEKYTKYFQEKDYKIKYQYPLRSFLFRKFRNLWHHDHLEKIDREKFEEIEELIKESWKNYLEYLKKNPKMEIKSRDLLIGKMIDNLRTANYDIEDAQEMFQDEVGNNISENIHVDFSELVELDKYEDLKDLIQEYPIFEYAVGDMMNELAQLISYGMLGAFKIAEKSIIITGMDYKSLKTPAPLRKEFVISEDISNLASVLYSLGKGRAPERVDRAVKHIFGENCSIYLEPTPDGRIHLKFTEGGDEWNPPSIPKGLYKLIALELALEHGAPILAVDEIENSLHSEAIEYFIDELKDSYSVGVMTTHSPAVMDFSKPEEIVIFEKDSEGATQPKRFGESEELSNKLKDQGITLSEYILYGES